MTSTYEELVNRIGNPTVRDTILKRYPNDKEAARIAAVVGVIMEDFIEKGLNAILEQHINPKLNNLEAILTELQKINEKLDELSDK